MAKKLLEKIELTKKQIKEAYLSDKRPWVITFSGGKGSTTVLHLTIEILLELPKEKRKKKKEKNLLLCLMTH